MVAAYEIIEEKAGRQKKYQTLRAMEEQGGRNYIKKSIPKNEKNIVNVVYASPHVFQNTSCTNTNRFVKEAERGTNITFLCKELSGNRAKPTETQASQGMMIFSSGKGGVWTVHKSFLSNLKNRDDGEKEEQ